MSHDTRPTIDRDLRAIETIKAANRIAGRYCDMQSRAAAERSTGVIRRALGRVGLLTVGLVAGLWLERCDPVGRVAADVARAKWEVVN